MSRWRCASGGTMSLNEVPRIFEASSTRREGQTRHASVTACDPRM
jgi:hypothetical protein